MTVEDEIVAVHQYALTLYTRPEIEIVPGTSISIDSLDIEETEDAVRRFGLIAHDTAAVRRLQKKITASVKEFAREKVLPEVQAKIAEPYFVREFPKFLQFLNYVSGSVTALLTADGRPLPDESDFGWTLKMCCIELVYFESGAALAEVLFSNLENLRVSNYDDIPLYNSLKDISHWFQYTDINDAVYVQPFYTYTRTQSRKYAETLDGTPAMFFYEALDRVFWEREFFVTFNIGGATERELLKKEILTGFAEDYNCRIAAQTAPTITDLFLDSMPTEQIAFSVFQDALRTFSNSPRELWDPKVAELKEKIGRNGRFWTIGWPPADQWSMEQLETAIYELGDWEIYCKSRIRETRNSSYPGLYRMVTDIFHDMFREMLPTTQNGVRREQRLAEFLHYVIAEEKFVNDVLSDRSQTLLKAINYDFTHLEHQDLFFQHVKRLINITDTKLSTEIYRQFDRFLNLENASQIPTSLRDVLPGLVSRLTLNPENALTMPIVQVQSNDILQTIPEDSLMPPAVHENRFQITVSASHVSPNRKSTHLRLSSSQLSVLEIMATYENLQVSDIYKLLIRDDIDGNQKQGIACANAVMESLYNNMYFLYRDQPSGQKIHPDNRLWLNRELTLTYGSHIFLPPEQVGPQILEEERYQIDTAILDYVFETEERQEQVLSPQVVSHVVSRIIVDLEVIRQRIEHLVYRRFLTRGEEDENVLKYVHS